MARVWYVKKNALFCLGNICKILDLEEQNGRLSATHCFINSNYTAYLKVVCTVLMLMTCCCWSQCEIAISICENIFTVFIAKVWNETLVVWALQFLKYDFGVVVV